MTGLQKQIVDTVLAKPALIARAMAGMARKFQLCPGSYPEAMSAMLATINVAPKVKKAIRFVVLPISLPS